MYVRTFSSKNRQKFGKNDENKSHLGKVSTPWRPFCSTALLLGLGPRVYSWNGRTGAEVSLTGTGRVDLCAVNGKLVSDC